MRRLTFDLEHDQFRDTARRFIQAEIAVIGCFDHVFLKATRGV